MGSINKSFSLLLIVLLAVSSLIMAKPAFAQPVPTPSFTGTPPSVPIFTVQLGGPSINVPTTYSLNSNTGQVVAQIGYTNEYSYVVITIKNQPFTPFNDSQGNPISFYYNVQINTSNETGGGWLDIYQAYNGCPTQSTDSDYTNLSIGIEGQMGVLSLAGFYLHIQVEANIGYIGREVVSSSSGQFLGVPYVFVGDTSGWSNTETVTVPANMPLSASPAPASSTSTLTPSPTLMSVSSASCASSSLITNIALVVIAILLAIIIFLLLYFRKQKPVKSSQQTVSNGGT